MNRFILFCSVGVLVGCNLNTAKQCKTNGDCGANATCNLSVHTCVGSVFTDGGGSLAISIVVPEVSRAQVDGGVVLDTSDATSYLRSDTAQIQVSIAGPVQAGTVQYTLQGVGDVSPSAPVTVVASPCAAGVDAGFCGAAAVDLSKPALNALRGNMTFAVTATGTDSSTSTQSAQIAVTRSKWTVQLQAPLMATPAIGPNGTVFVASAADAGVVLALRPDASWAWAQPFVSNNVVASPTLGSQYLYVAQAVDPLSYLFTVDSATGQKSALDPCTYQKRPDAGVTGKYLASIALFAYLDSTTSKEAALDVINDEANSGTLVASTPGGLNDCDFVPVANSVRFPGTVIATDSKAFVGGIAGLVQSFAISSSTGPIFSFDSDFNSTGEESIGHSQLGGLAVSSSALYVLSGTSGVYSVLTSDGGDQTSATTDASQAAAAIAIDSSGFTYVGDGISAIYKVNPINSAATMHIVAEAITAAPLLGKNGHVYTAGLSGGVTVLDSSLNSIWTASLAEPGGFSASPTIDCARYSDGGIATGPGTLYLAGNGGRLYAIIVDSHGLDTTAAWPKYQHDSANTGNSSLPILNCP